MTEVRWDEERFAAVPCVEGFTTCTVLIVECSVDALVSPSPPHFPLLSLPSSSVFSLPFPSPSPYPNNPLSLSLTLLPLLTPTILSHSPYPSSLSFYPYNPLSLSLPLPPPLHSPLPPSLPFLLLSVLPPPSPCRVLHEVAAMNNYFGIGFDAKIMYEFRTRREENPKQYTSVQPTHTHPSDISAFKPVQCC